MKQEITVPASVLSWA